MTNIHISHSYNFHYCVVAFINCYCYFWHNHIYSKLWYIMYYYCQGKTIGTLTSCCYWLYVKVKVNCVFHYCIDVSLGVKLILKELESCERSCDILEMPKYREHLYNFQTWLFWVVYTLPVLISWNCKHKPQTWSNNPVYQFAVIHCAHFIDYYNCMWDITQSVTMHPARPGKGQICPLIFHHVDWDAYNNERATWTKTQWFCRRRYDRLKTDW